MAQGKKNFPTSYLKMYKSVQFFKCYKHKQMEACLLQDISQKISTGLFEDLPMGFDAENVKHFTVERSANNLSTAAFLSLYGSNNIFNVL